MWLAVLCVDDGKLFVFDKMPVPEARLDQAVQEWHDQRLLHPVLEKMRLDLKWRFEFPPGLCKTFQAVCRSC